MDTFFGRSGPKMRTRRRGLLSVLVTLSMGAGLTVAVMPLAAPPARAAQLPVPVVELVHEINPGTASSNPKYFINFDDEWLYFTATQADLGDELWRTDGTTTELAYETKPGSGNGNVRPMTVMDDWLYFTGGTDDGPAGGTAALWRTNGSSVIRIPDPDPDYPFFQIARQLASKGNDLDFAIADGHLFFPASKVLPNSGYPHLYPTQSTIEGELYFTDGNTMQKHDIDPRPVTDHRGSGKPGALFSFNNQVHFSGSDPDAEDGIYSTSRAMWADSSGFEVVPNGPASKGAFAYGTHHAFNGTLHFHANDADQRGQWTISSSGSASYGTVQSVLRADPNLFGDPVLKFHDYQDFMVYFDSDGIYSTTGSLYRTDGFGSTPIPYASGVDTAPFKAGDYAELDDVLYFVAQVSGEGWSLWYTDGDVVDRVTNSDGTPTEVFSGPGGAFGLTVFDGFIYFLADDGDGGGLGLWRTNGATTHAVTWINQEGDTVPVRPRNLAKIRFIEFNDHLYFAGHDPARGVELWRLSHEAPFEGPYGSPACEDGVDNDDNGLIDGADPGCQQPDAPTDFSAVAGDAFVDLSWTGPADAVKFEITAQPGGKKMTVDAVGSPQQSATMKGLKNGTTYTFSLEAENHYGSKSPIVTSDPVTPKVSKPAQVKNVKLKQKYKKSKNKQQLEVKWSALPASAEVTRYRVTLTPKKGKSTTKNVSASTKKYVFKNLKPGGYTVQVRADNSAGAGKLSKKTSVTLLARPAQVKKVKLKGKASKSAKKQQVTVIWKKLSSKEKVNKYQVRLVPKKGKKQTKTVKKSKKKHVFKKLKRGTYTVQVRANNPNGYGKWSKKVKITLR